MEITNLARAARLHEKLENEKDNLLFIDKGKDALITIHVRSFGETRKFIIANADLKHTIIERIVAGVNENIADLEADVKKLA